MNAELNRLSARLPLWSW